MRQRVLVLGLVAALTVVAVALAVVVAGRGEEPPRTLAPAAGQSETTEDPLAWDGDRRAEFERRAAAGLSHVLYAKSPGGAIASAARTARWRPLVERAARGSGVDPD